MKEKFRDKKFGAEKLILLKHIDTILKEFDRQDIKVTLRQLYYQLVTKELIPNKKSEYSRLSELLTDARYCGLVDWEAIEDRIRVPKMHSEFKDVPDLIESAKYSYRLDRWKGQENYVELWTEKDALSSILHPIANKWHIHFCVNRGYSSATAMYDASKRVAEAIDDGKKVIILYLGDHDPSGEDMVRDIRQRLIEFGGSGGYDGNDEPLLADEDEELDFFHVTKIALTDEQVKMYRPPPNPAKMTDPRADAYVRQHGATSWEVDALRPDVMIKLVEQSILDLVDLEKMMQIQDKEKKDMKQLENFGKKVK
jgi:hypothetical protein